MDRYEGPIAPDMVFTCPDNDGRLGLRRVRVIALDHGSVVFENLPGRAKYVSVGTISRCPELNLRIVFVPEQAQGDDPGRDST